MFTSELQRDMFDTTVSHLGSEDINCWSFPVENFPFPQQSGVSCYPVFLCFIRPLQGGWLVCTSASHCRGAGLKMILHLLMEWPTVFTDNGLPKCSLVHEAISHTINTQWCRYLMQCHWRDRKSQAFNVVAWPRRLGAEISPDSQNHLMILWTVDDWIPTGKFLHKVVALAKSLLVNS